MGVGRVIAAIGSGAAAMYFLDPEEGDGRRRFVGRTARNVGSHVGRAAAQSRYLITGEGHKGKDGYWSPRTRGIVGGIGAGLAVWGVLRHDKAGKVMTTVGGLMVSRSISNRGAKNLVSLAAQTLAA